MPLRIATGKQGIIWHGSFFVYHSLALVNRELTLALLDTGRFDIGLKHYEQPQFGAEADPRFGELVSRSLAHPEGPGITVRHLWPPDFTRPETSKFVLIQPWEFGSLPKAWVENIARSVDEVWVPSTFVRDEYVTSGVSGGKVFVVPNGVNTSRFHPGVAPMALPTNKRVKFLFVGGTISRKGIDVLLDSYSRTFTSNDDVTLIIKDFGVNSFYTGQDAAALIAEIRLRPDAPEIVHLTADMSEDGIAQLYASCDCLVHPYRGEGYGLPIAEAMACGKPTIITNYGAALDFACARNSYLVPATVVRMPEKRIGDMETVEHPFWAEPDRDALGAILRHCYEKPEEAKAIGQRAADDIAAGQTWAHAAQIAAVRLETLSQQGDHKPVIVSLPATGMTQGSYHPGTAQRKQESIALVRSGNWNAAISLIEASLLEDPNDWELINALSVALFRTGEKTRAKEMMRRGIARAPNPRDFHHNLAFLLLNEGSYLEALEHATEAFLQSPDSDDIRRTLERTREAAVGEERRLRRVAESGKSNKHKNGKDSAKRGEAYRAIAAAVTRAGALLDGQPDPGAPKAQKTKPKLSVVMIVKDEEKFLRRSLESVKGLADEIVVVDTGSTDSTVAIAGEFGARVFHHAWTDDFSAARNVSLDYAVGDWALWLDADEELAEGQGKLLHTLIDEADRAVGGYLVNIRNYLSDSKTEDVCWHRACRLFRIAPNVRFVGRIHEQNVRPLQDAGYKLEITKLTLDHYGYASAVMDERNKHERFIRMLTREVEENPDDSFRIFHFFNLGNAYYTYGDMKNAIKWLEKVVEHPDTVEEYTIVSFIELATAYYMTDRSYDALAICEKAESLNLHHPGFDFARGHAYLTFGRYEEAEASFRTAVESKPSSEVAFVGDAGAYTYKAYYGMALAAMGRDRVEAAIELCRKALAIRADFADAMYLIATALIQLDCKREACKELEKLLEHVPTHKHAIADLGNLLFEMKEYPAALSSLRRTAAGDPGSLIAWVHLAECCENMGLYEEARDANLEARRLSPQSADICVNLGRAYAALGDEAKAIDCFADAIIMDQRCAQAYFNAADSLYRLGQYPRAVETLCSGLVHDPQNAAGFFVLGNCYYQTGDYEAARFSYAEALKRRPDYPEAVNNLSLVDDILTEKSLV